MPNACTEIGLVVVLPAYQRTHVASNAVGLMMQYALNSPGEGGLGLRRVVWHTSSMNGASQRVAEKFGFKKEGVFRWHMFFEKGRRFGKVGNGRGLPPGSDVDDLWRDTVVYAFCWDGWDESARGVVKGLMDRGR